MAHEKTAFKFKLFIYENICKHKNSTYKMETNLTETQTKTQPALRLLNKVNSSYKYCT